MLVSEKRILIGILRSVLDEKPFSEEIAGLINSTSLSSVYNIAKKQDLAHFIGYSFDLNGIEYPDVDTARLCESALYSAKLRGERTSIELKRLCQLLQNAQIQYIPLKGAVIRNSYPASWLRTSCDIDILVHKADLNKAVDVFKKQLNYTQMSISAHDISLRSEDGVNLELHYGFSDPGVSHDEIWAESKPRDDDPYRYEMSGETFLFCHLAHMAKHFGYGGCGIRPFADIYVMKKALHYDSARLEKMLAEKSLSQFAKAVFDLTDVWFADKESSAELDFVADCVLNGSVHGDMQTKVAIKQTTKKSRSGYIFSRIFLKRSVLKYAYPIVEKHPLLTPFCQIHRLIKVIFTGKLKKATDEFKIAKNTDEASVDNASRLLDILGIGPNP